MGNCIIRQNKVMQTGQIVAGHKEPLKVHQVLPEILPVSGQMYCPVPLPVEFNKNPEIKAESESSNGVMRIKLVITKQELELMMRKGGVSVGDLVSHMKKESSNKAVVIEDEDSRYCGRWKPILDSIPELN